MLKTKTSSSSGGISRDPKRETKNLKIEFFMFMYQLFFLVLVRFSECYFVSSVTDWTGKKL